MILSKFNIQKLHGKFDLAIEIVDNKLILVAKNGASKTTVLRIMFYFLTKQWEDLCTFEFSEIDAEIDGKTFRFDKEEYLNSKSPMNGLIELSRAYPMYKDFILEELPKWDLMQIRERSQHVEVIAEHYDMPAGLLAKFLDTLIAGRQPAYDFDWQEYILYLPTYRRIEEDFNIIFSDFNVSLGNYIRDISEDPGYITIEEEDDIQVQHSMHDELLFTLWNNRDREKWLNKKENLYLELIEFGMEDISFKIKEFLQSENSQSTIETKLNSYLKVCNSYLQPEKSLQYKENSLKVILQETPQDREIGLSELSSGEKQIVALFFHLFLEESQPFVIIDEPEISLSLRWQENILTDILSSNVSGLVVATHSPFVVGDDLRSYAHGINEFTL